MGTPIPPPEFGNDCIACFDADDTPKFIYVVFDGVKVGDDPTSKQLPNLQIFKCIQTIGIPCEWIYNEGGAGWIVTVWRSSVTGNWFVVATFAGVGGHFHGTILQCPVEHQIFANAYWSPIFWKGWDGVACIFWNDWVWFLLDGLNIPAESTFLEFFLIDQLKPVYKFCNLELHLNFRIEVPV